MEAMVAVGAMAISSELRRPTVFDALAQSLPACAVVRRDSPQVELELALRGAGFVEGCVRAVLLGQIAGGGEGVEVNLFLNLRGERAGFWRVEGETHLKEDILQAHDTEADRPPRLLEPRPAGRGSS